MDSAGGMIRPGFLSDAERTELRALARDGLSEARAARRANAIVLLDDGWSCEEVAAAFLIDDDTVRSWFKLHAEHGLTGLVVFDVGGSESHLTRQQESELVEWVRANAPRTSRLIGAWIAATWGVEYSHAGLLALLHRLKLDYRKPEVVPRQLDAAKQQAFIKSYNDLMNNLGDDEAVLFGDAVHPIHQARAVGCWAPKGETIVLEQTSGLR